MVPYPPPSFLPSCLSDTINKAWLVDVVPAWDARLFVSVPIAIMHAWIERER